MPALFSQSPRTSDSGGYVHHAALIETSLQKHLCGWLFKQQLWVRVLDSGFWWRQSPEDNDFEFQDQIILI
jgi:hypothetical protein